MKCLLAILLLFVVSPACLCARITPFLALSVNVVDYGAEGDGQTDDSQAFLKAWQDVCNAADQGSPTLIIPEGKTFMLQPLKFTGPCKPATVKIELQGTIVAPSSIESWKWPNNDEKKLIWVQFLGISGLVIKGGGQIDGQGAPWWNLKRDSDSDSANSDSDSASDRPNALHFHDCENLRLSGLTHINSPRNHISINMCNGSHISNLHIIAPADSPNTDGIDISGSSNIRIQDSKMETGDDCIAINGGTSFINISGVYCGPGHGISVGSLGKDGACDKVEEIHVLNCTFDGTTNGARIKTWAGGGGYARKIRFEDIILVDAKNPVIIDQQYDPHFIHNNNNNDDDGEGVEVSDVIYRNVSGTAAGEDVIIKLSCDPNIGCNDIVMEEINIKPASFGNNVYASCTKAQGRCSSCIPTVPCLSN